MCSLYWALQDVKSRLIDIALMKPSSIAEDKLELLQLIRLQIRSMIRNFFVVLVFLKLLVNLINLVLFDLQD